MLDLLDSDWQRAADPEPFLARNRAFTIVDAHFRTSGPELVAAVAEDSWLVKTDIRWQVVRGNNLHGLPYLFLDAPQWIRGKEYFLIRSICWWGRGFRLSLQTDIPHLRTPLQEEMRRLGGDGFVATWQPEGATLTLDLNPSPWQWHRQSGQDSEVLLTGKHTNNAERGSRHAFVKIDLMWPFGPAAGELHRWSERQRELLRRLDTLYT